MSETTEMRTFNRMHSDNQSINFHINNATERQTVLLLATVSNVTIVQRRWQANDMKFTELWCNYTVGIKAKYTEKNTS
jgi:hypothetical protein